MQKAVEELSDTFRITYDLFFFTFQTKPISTFVFRIAAVFDSSNWED
jgi:hypothetical protein